MVAVGALVVLLALAVGGYMMWAKKKAADGEVLRVEQTRLADSQRQQEAQQRQVELERRLQAEAELRKNAEAARREAVATATTEAEARRGAEARERALKERDLTGRPAAGAMSDGFREASQAARRGDNATAVSKCRRSAQEGDVRCQYLIGLLYATGKVGHRREADFRVAADMLGRAANQGLATAQFNFGVMNERGLGMPQDMNAAIGWYKKAASQGDSNARQTLARLSSK